MNKISLFLLFCGFYCAAFSQALVTNNGAGFYMTNGANMIINASATYTDGLTNNQGTVSVGDGAYIHIVTNSLYNNGTLNNQGIIKVEGYVKNDGTITGNGDTIQLYYDWINDNAYTGNNSWVDMYGDAQSITGTAVTTFNNLNLVNSSVKSQTINAVTTGQLALNSAELYTETNEMYVSNTNANAITWGSGFVSSAGAGRLSRATNSTGAYSFPVGSPSLVNGPSIFRPLQITPAGANADEYGAMVVKGDATISGFDVKSFDDSLCAVNPNFFHQLYRVSGADAAAITMTFDPNTDGSWTDEAHWGQPVSNLWNYLGQSTPGTAFNLSSVTVQGVNNFSPQPFALAKKKFTITAGGPYDITQGQSVALDPTINTTATIDSIVWSPVNNLSCTTCLTPSANPSITTIYTITVTDASGCQAVDSVQVTVLPDELLVPTGFSPELPPNNYFHVLNKNIAKLDLQVYNRWGEKVYETEDPNDHGWDGTYKGIKQGTSVFVWQCQYQFLNSTKLQNASGNVTLIR